MPNFLSVPMNEERCPYQDFSKRTYHRFVRCLHPICCVRIEMKYLSTNTAVNVGGFQILKRWHYTPQNQESVQKTMKYGSRIICTFVRAQSHTGQFLHFWHRAYPVLYFSVAEQEIHLWLTLYARFPFYSDKSYNVNCLSFFPGWGIKKANNIWWQISSDKHS